MYRREVHLGIADGCIIVIRCDVNKKWDAQTQGTRPKILCALGRPCMQPPLRQSQERPPVGPRRQSSSIPRDSPWRGRDDLLVNPARSPMAGPGRSSRQCASGWPCTRPTSRKSRGRRRGRTKARTETRQATEETRRGRLQAQVLRRGLQRC